MTLPAHRYWSNLSTEDIRQRVGAGTVAVLPLAAIEQHGPHLPLSTDLDIGMGLAETAFAHLPDEIDALLLPPLAIGLSLEHAHYPGTLSLSPATAQAVIAEVGGSIAAAGVRRLILFNSHGGNKAIVDLAALGLRAAHAMLVVRANYFRFAPPADALPAQELRHGLHGGALETSMMLHLAPSKVRSEALAHWPSLGCTMADHGMRLGPEGEAGFAWLAGDLHPAGVTGNAHLANAALGARLVAHFSAVLTELIIDTARFDLAWLNRHDQTDAPRTI